MNNLNQAGTPESNREHALFVLAIAKDEAGRAAFLDAECAGDPVLRNRLEALLAAHEKSGDVLGESNIAAAKGTMKVEPISTPDESIGQRIGRYKILEKIGEGGCGVVYVAEQTEPVRRRVALKIIKPGMDTKQVIARFEAERQALAMMDHPNIAKVLDAGATGAGRPYFVMELVRGIKITDYCDQNNLTTLQRLQLFVQVCQAIQHAHQKGIIHRDVKPSNILVTVNDGVPVPKVIDFGIAKATQGRLTDQTIYTAFEQFIGTPAYMSPEQAEMTSLDIDTRSDIYSLGVLLYELLTGRTPFDAKELMAAGLDAMRRTIREREPVRPSTRLSTMLEADLTLTAKHRQTEAPRLIHLLRGDLDWIVMKALDKDRTRRYETANGLAMDVQRYLNDEIVSARPPSRMYRIQKTIRRNKLAFAAGLAVTLALVLGLASSLWQARRARVERDAATQARLEAEAINRFLTEDLLYQATPEANAREKQVTMEEVLARAALRLDKNPDISRHPQLEATLRFSIGSTYFKLGEYPQAEIHYRQAVRLRENNLGGGHLDTLLARKALACLLSLYMTRWDDETKHLAWETWQGLQKAVDQQSDSARRSQIARDMLDCAGAYIYCLIQTGEMEKAQKMKVENVAAYSRYFGPDDPDTVTALQDLATFYELSGEFRRAEDAYRQAMQRFDRAGLGNTFEGLNCLHNLAWVRFLLGHTQEAESALQEMQPRAKRLLGAEHPLTLGIQFRLARVLAEQARWREAEELAEATLNLRHRVSKPEDGRTAYTGVVLARLLIERGELQRAESLLTEARRVFRQNFPNQPRLAAAAENWLGAIFLARKDYATAAEYLLPLADQFLHPTIQMSPNERRICLGHIVALYRAWEKPEKAAEWQMRLETISLPDINSN